MKYYFFIAATFLFSNTLFAQPTSQTMEVGVARIDITPEGPIRLAGYGARPKAEATEVIQKLEAKALAFGSDAQGASILITVDLVGIPWHMTKKLSEQLSSKINVRSEQLVICASHTHGGPEVGNLLNILQYRKEDAFSDSLLSLNELVHISRYIDQLAQKLEQVSLAAMKDRKPALVAWGQGQALFAKNRRTPGGPVDVSLPILRVTDTNGKLRAVLANYACHGTTLPGDVNQVHGDWMGEAQRMIEAKHPEVVSLIAIGCGADANPQPRGKIENVQTHAHEIADHVEKLLTSAQLRSLTTPPVGRVKWVSLPFAKKPTIPELIVQTEDKTVKGYYARLALDRIARGGSIPVALDYPIQTWAFGNELLMINLAGEVVVDYSLRLKEEIGADRVWMNAYSNDVPCYIASKRVIKEGGYEAESSMYYYDKPSPFAEEVEDIIIQGVHDILPPAFTATVSKNHPEIINADVGKTIDLQAEVATAIGPEIKYMPEWKAFGWFTESDQMEWDIEINKKGKYDVYLDWSVSDQEAGKPFIISNGNQQINGKVGKSGSWFTYRSEKIGRISLLAGSNKLIFKPGPQSPKGALLDLRSIKLVPVN